MTILKYPSSQLSAGMEEPAVRWMNAVADTIRMKVIRTVFDQVLQRVGPNSGFCLIPLEDTRFTVYQIHLLLSLSLGCNHTHTFSFAS